MGGVGVVVVVGDIVSYSYLELGLGSDTRQFVKRVT